MTLPRSAGRTVAGTCRPPRPIDVRCSSQPADSTGVGRPRSDSRVAVETTKGTFVLAIDRAFAPRGVDRFHRAGDGRLLRRLAVFPRRPRLHRAVRHCRRPGDHPSVEGSRIVDDSVRTSNVRGTIAFAMNGPQHAHDAAVREPRGQQQTGRAGLLAVRQRRRGDGRRRPAVRRVWRECWRRHARAGNRRG